MIDRLNSHLKTMREEIESLSDLAFSTIVNSVMVDISAKDKNMQEEHDRWWNEIS